MSLGKVCFAAIIPIFLSGCANNSAVSDVRGNSTVFELVGSRGGVFSITPQKTGVPLDIEITSGNTNQLEFCRLKVSHKNGFIAQFDIIHVRSTEYSMTVTGEVVHASKVQAAHGGPFLNKASGGFTTRFSAVGDQYGMQLRSTTGGDERDMVGLRLDLADPDRVLFYGLTDMANTAMYLCANVKSAHAGQSIELPIAANTPLALMGARQVQITIKPPQ